MTELDLRESLIPVSLIEHLAMVMPRSSTGEGYDYLSYLDGVTVASNGTRSSSEETRVAGGMARSRSTHYM
jgi:hypothetical protein